MDLLNTPVILIMDKTVGISGLLLVCVVYFFTAGFTSRSVTSKVPEHFSTAGWLKRNLCHFRIYGSNI